MRGLRERLLTCGADSSRASPGSPFAPKITLTLGAVFAGSMALSVAVSAPLLGQQRQRLLEQDKRLMGTLRHTYEREFIYDILSESEESLAGHLAGSGAPGGCRPRSSHGRSARRRGLGGSGHAGAAARGALQRDVADARRSPPDATAMAGRGSIGAGGRPVVSDLSLSVEEPPISDLGGADAFSERRWHDLHVLHLRAELTAADEHFGTLQLLYSLAPLEESARLTRVLFYGALGVTFLVAVLLLNLVLSRIVIVPVREVMDGMARAERGDLEVRLPVRAGDELATVASAFNRMTEQLASSRSDVEAQSRELEARVAQRTGGAPELRGSAAQSQEPPCHGDPERWNRSRCSRRGGDRGDVQRPGGGDSRDRCRQLHRPAHRSGAPARGRGVAPDPGLRRCRAGGDGDAARSAGGRPSGRGAENSLVRRFGASRRRRRPSGCRRRLRGPDAAHRDAATRGVEGGRRAGHSRDQEPADARGSRGADAEDGSRQDPARFETLFPSAVDMILRAVQDLKELITEFSRFSRLPEMRTSASDVNALVLSPSRRTSRLRPKASSSRRSSVASLPEIEVDVDQVRRVLFNIVNNAVEAMDGRGGRLVLRTSADEGGVLITVEDEGPGVDDVERIFEPHYTTKVKGTGLGLAIARQIVEEHGGRIRVSSVVGRGTTVRIHLPTGPGAVPRRSAALAGESGDALPIVR